MISEEKKQLDFSRENQSLNDKIAEIKENKGNQEGRVKNCEVEMEFINQKIADS